MALAVVSFAAPAAAQTGDAESVATAYYQYLLGRHLESANRIDEAIAAHRRAAELDPGAAQIPAELANLYARHGRLPEAVAAARAALSLDAGSVDAHLVLGSIFASLSDEDARALSVTPAEAARLAIGHLEKGRRADGIGFDPAVELTLARLYLASGETGKGADVLGRLVSQAPEIVEARILLARAETALGRPDRAIAALEGGADDSPRLLWALAELYQRQERWPEAARAYERLTVVAPGLDMRQRWAYALLQVGTAEAAAQARRVLEDIVAAAPTDTRALALLAAAARRTRDFDAAERTAKRLMELEPDSADGLIALAQVYEDQRRFGPAVDLLAPAVERLWADPARRPDLLTLVAHLGYAQLQAGQADAAIATFERARALAPDHGGFDTALVQAHVLAGRYERAVALARTARARRPGDLRLSQLEARALTRSGRRDRAVVVMREALAAHAGEVQAHLSLAEALQEADRIREADEVLAEAAARFPGSVDVAFQQGALLEQRQEYAGAEAAFRRVLAREPDHAPTLNYLGYMLADRGERLDEAVALIERALAIDPGNGAYLDSLGWAYYRQGRYRQAEPLLRRAAEQLPTNSVVQEHFGDVLAALGRRDEAVGAWKRALAGDREAVDVDAIGAKIRGR